MAKGESENVKLYVLQNISILLHLIIEFNYVLLQGGSASEGNNSHPLLSELRVILFRIILLTLS